MRLLIAEDDPLLADTLARGFREHAYAVDVATDGAQALSLARINDYDAVVLDIMMPRRDGLSVCAALRGAGQHVPILMLTARDALSERLDHAFEQQRRFMADASHELRTPVALVRAEADVALSRETRTETEYRDALEVVRGGARRLSAIVEDIFLLARADAGRVPIERKTVYLDEIVTDAARAVRSLVP